MRLNTAPRKALQDARARWAIAVLAILCLTCVAGAAAARRSPPRRRPATFVIGETPALPLSASFLASSVHGIQQFSLENGAPLRTLLTLKGGEGRTQGFAPGPEGTLWLTRGTGPRSECRRCKESPQVPNSCTGEVTRFDPTTGALTTEHKFPSSVLLGGAQVSPDGQWLLATVGVCTSYQNQHLLAINLVTGAEWTVGASATACHSLGAVSWNETGSELVVPFGPSNLPPGSTHGQRMIGGESCLVHKPVGLAVVNTGSSSEFSEHALIEPASGCEYESAIFDSEGILAVEGCTEGAPHRQHFQPEPREGQAYLLQLSESGEIVRRLPLAVGSEPGLVASDPETGTILVSDDVGREGSECDWIWEYANGTLRLIKRYSEDLFVKPW